MLSKIIFSQHLQMKTLLIDKKKENPTVTKFYVLAFFASFEASLGKQIVSFVIALKPLTVPFLVVHNNQFWAKNTF